MTPSGVMRAWFGEVQPCPGDPGGDVVVARMASVAGNLAQVSDPAGNRWTYEHDLLGRQVRSVDPDRGATRTTYDDAGQVTSVTDARGERLTYAYDGLGRRTQVSQDGAVRASWVYDTLVKGHLSSSSRFDGGAEFTSAVTGYDDSYRVLGQQVSVPASEGALAGVYETSFTYTPGGVVESVTLPAAGGLGQETVTTFYDDRSMPEVVGRTPRVDPRRLRVDLHRWVQVAA